MSERPYRDDYEKLFLELCKKVERLLIKSIAAVLVLLIVSQTLLQIPLIRRLISPVDSLEGVPYRLTPERASNEGLLAGQGSKHH